MKFRSVIRLALWSLGGLRLTADRDTGDGGVLVMPDGSRAYLGLRDDHSVVEVDLKTLEVAHRWPMGADSGPGCINWASLK